MSATIMDSPHEAEHGLRFPLATVGQVRREVARQLRTIPRARWWFLLAVVLLGVGSIHLVTIGDNSFFATNYTKEELEALPDFDEKTVRK